MNGKQFNPEEYAYDFSSSELEDLKMIDYLVNSKLYHNAEGCDKLSFPDSKKWSWVGRRIMEEEHPTPTKQRIDENRLRTLRTEATIMVVVNRLLCLCDERELEIMTEKILGMFPELKNHLEELYCRFKTSLGVCANSEN
jgi:hypothetical protein